MGIIQKSLGVLAVFAACVGIGWAETQSPDWFYRAWQTEDGLPDNSVTGLAQSPDGFLWVATRGGLMRFNGAEFAAVPLRQIPDLPSRAVRAMFLDRSGRLWVAMNRGPLVGLGEEDIAAYYPADGLLPQLIQSIAEDGEGRLWLAYSGDVCRIDQGRVIRLPSLEGVPRRGAEAFLVNDHEGKIWLARGDTMGVFRGDQLEQRLRFSGQRLVIAAAHADPGLWITVGARVMKFQEGNQPEEVVTLPSDALVNVLYEDRGGRLWIGTRLHGLYQFSDGVLLRVPTSRPDITSVTQDQEGFIWVGTNGSGLQLVRPRSVSLIDRDQGLPFLTTQSVCEDASGALWTVSGDGGLAYAQDGKWSEVTSQDTWPGGKAACVAADAHGRVWVGMKEKGLMVREDGGWRILDKSDGLSPILVRSILAAKNGDIWIGGEQPKELVRWRDGVFQTMQVRGRIRTVRALAEGIDGTIWVGTAEGRILRVEGDQAIDEPLITERVPLSVRTLHVTDEGSLWIGFAGDGIGWLKDGRYTRLTTDDGLPDNYISQILGDGRGSLWITANRGIFTLDLAELIEACEGSRDGVRPRVFGHDDGLPSLQPNRNYAPSAWQSVDGDLWFSMRGGLLRVEPEWNEGNLSPPPVVIEEVRLDDQVVATLLARSLLRLKRGEEFADLSEADVMLKVPPGHEKVEFSFSALSLSSPENVHFRYRLRPFERHWVEAGTRRSAVYPRLPAGEYEFQVLGCNNAGVWNEEGKILRLEVAPYYWETWTFKVGGGVATALLAGGLVYFGLRRRHSTQLRRMARRRAVEQERSRIARDIHDDLGASLTRITLLSQGAGGEVDESQQGVLDQIHETARELMRSMEEVVWAVNPKHDTFDALANYLSNYAQGFLSLAGVRCRLDVPLNLPKRSLSAQVRHNLFLAFKEALNNLVKYANASEARIVLSPGLSGFSLRVEDDGRGLGDNCDKADERGVSGTGLANMRIRMDEIGGSCDVRSGEESGTIVEFTVPFMSAP